MQPRLLRSPARLAGASLLRVQTDDRLVALARDGHERAFAAIVERYGPALERYAARLVGPTRGEDAVQQAFVNAHAALIANPDKPIELRPWLYRIVHNAALNTLRAARDEQPLGDAAEQLALEDDAIERRERLREALDALATLPAKQRDAILLRELEGRSHDEIAVALGLTPGAARQQIFRARAALRAAATAITPQPLLIRTLELAAGGGSGAADVAAGAGAGLTAVLAKAGAGVLVTGAVVGGAVGTGVVHTPHLHQQRPPAAKEAAAHQRAIAAPAALGSAATRPAGSVDHGARAGEHHSTSRGQRSGEHRRGGDSGGSDRGRRDSSTPVRRPVGAHSGPGRAGSGTQETHHSGGGDDAAGTQHTDPHGRHGGHGGRGGRDQTVAGATTQPESTEVETEQPEVETDPGGGGGANSGGGGGGGTTTTTPTDAAPPATTTGGAVTPAPTGGGGAGGGGGGATSLVPPESGGKGK
ncbi:MAG TPA: RNA polymerase sigma factor [Solirubrobacteraceae bacterium]